MARTGRPREFDVDTAIDAAMRLFWRKGYGATSVEDLVGETGVQRGSLYAAFGDKRSLFLAGLQRYAAWTDGELRRVAGLPPDRLVPGLRELVVGMVHGGRGSGVGCLLGNTASELVPRDAAVTAAVERGFSGTVAGVADILRRARAAGQIGAHVDPDVAALAVVALWQGLLIVGRTETDSARLDAAVDALLDTWRARTTGG